MDNPRQDCEVNFVPGLDLLEAAMVFGVEDCSLCDSWNVTAASHMTWAYWGSYGSLL
jgi:hypothetical protein